MNYQPPTESRLSQPRAIAHMKTVASAILSCLPSVLAEGQERMETSIPEQPKITFTVLEQKRIDLGDRSIVFNRVLPPLLPPALPVPEPVLTPEQSQALAERAAKRSAVLFVSATVYDRQVSALRWSDEHGSHRALSNIDFNYLVGVGGFETADTWYTLILGLGNESLAETKSDLPLRVTNFSPSRSEYAILEDKTAPTDEDLSALDALHVFFYANKPRLIAESAKREAAREERERWLEEHPPVPQDTVINYWIGHGGGTVILDKRNVGGKP